MQALGMFLNAMQSTPLCSFNDPASSWGSQFGKDWTLLLFRFISPSAMFDVWSVVFCLDELMGGFPLPMHALS